MAANKFSILSLDGGGTKGYIPLLVLEQIEEITGKKIHELFDLIIGTSTGGIITCGLTVSENGSDNLYSLKDLKEFYKEHAKTIFPDASIWSKIKSVRRPLFNEEGISQVLKEYFKESRISDCLTPIMVTTFDLKENKPLIFKSRLANVGSQSYGYRKNAFLYDICRATSAAPYYLPSYSFNYTDSDGSIQKKLECIDGGVYINNPSLAALTEIKMFKEDVLYNKPLLKDDDIHILSIGTGEYYNDYTNSKTNNWGIHQWALPLLDTMMSGVSRIVDYQTERLIKPNIFTENYLRANITIEEKTHKDMTTNKIESFQYFEKEVKKQLLNNNAFLTKLDQFLNNAEII